MLIFIFIIINVSVSVPFVRILLCSPRNLYQKTRLLSYLYFCWLGFDTRIKYNLLDKRHIDSNFFHTASLKGLLCVFVCVCASLHHLTPCHHPFIFMIFMRKNSIHSLNKREQKPTNNKKRTT